MKDLEKKTRSVLERIREEKEKRSRRARAVRRMAAPVLSLCFLALLGFAARRAGGHLKQPGPAPAPDPDGEIRRAEEPEVWPDHPILKPGDEGYIDPGPEPIRDLPDGTEGACVNLSALREWEHKTLTLSLADALDAATADQIFDIPAHPCLDYSFVHEGRSLAQLYSDMCDERVLPEILAQLLKEGDALKYGEALCGEDPPGGEQWDRSFYEERIAFYGPQILEKYLVDGTFLRDLAQADLESAKTADQAARAYGEGVAAYLRHLASTLETEIPAEVDASGSLLLHMTAAEFRDFLPDRVEGWLFGTVTVPEGVHGG